MTFLWDWVLRITHIKLLLARDEHLRRPRSARPSRG